MNIILLDYIKKMFFYKYYESFFLNDYLIFIFFENENELKFFFKILYDCRK